MSNVVNFDDYRRLRELLQNDEEFRNWASAFIREYEAASPNFSFDSPYQISSFRYNGIEVTSNSNVFTLTVKDE